MEQPSFVTLSSSSPPHTILKPYFILSPPSIYIPIGQKASAGSGGFPGVQSNQLRGRGHHHAGGAEAVDVPEHPPGQTAGERQPGAATDLQWRPLLWGTMDHMERYTFRKDTFLYFCCSSWIMERIQPAQFYCIFVVLGVLGDPGVLFSERAHLLHT